MPCSDGMFKDREAVGRERRSFLERIDELARLLCEANQILDDCYRLDFKEQRHPPTLARSPELQSWWKEHQRLDAERVEREKRERAARLILLRDRWSNNPEVQEILEAVKAGELEI